MLHRQVQFPETDASGIVHFTNYFKYMEEAEHAMWRSAGLSIAWPDPAIGFPRVAASFEYRRPLRFEDEFDVHLAIVEKGAKSLRYHAVLRRDTEVIAEGFLTIVCVRREHGGMKATDLPPEIADRFEVIGSSESF